MNPKPNLDAAERVAFVTSEQPNATISTRWTELAVYFDRTYGDRPWIAVVRGCSTHPGETPREEVVRVGTLERALKLFDPNSSLTRSIAVQAEQWNEERVQQLREDFEDTLANLNCGGVKIPVYDGGGKALAPAFDGHTDDEALGFLFGDHLERMRAAVLVSSLFGVNESSVRMQLTQGRDVKISLREAARFMDPARVRDAAAAIVAEKGAQRRG